jgi:diacylglycerol kinase family enzyme
MPVVTFVVNRTLLRDPRKFLRCCRLAADDRGWKPWFAPTGEAEDGLALTRRAVAAGASLVFAAGGDGTVRACAEALAGTGVPLAIVPLGTANLTARAVGVPARADRAVEAGFDGRDRRIDLALLDGTGIDGTGIDGTGLDGTGLDGTGLDGTGLDGTGLDGTRVDMTNRSGTSRSGIERSATTFAAMAGIGLDAAVVGAADERLKRRLGWVAYAVSGVTRLSLPPRDFTLRLDGAEPLRRRARCVVVANAGLLPGGFTLLPGARLDDGLLDVGILAPSGTWGWVRLAGRVLARGRREDRSLERFQARHVQVCVDVELPRQVDGEIVAPGQTLSVSVCPGVLVVRQPETGQMLLNGRADARATEPGLRSL